MGSKTYQIPLGIGLVLYDFAIFPKTTTIIKNAIRINTTFFVIDKSNNLKDLPKDFLL